MKFSEAMEKLKSGSKVTREPWKDGVYFLMDGNDVKSFQPKLSIYAYNEDIMVSDGWLVEGKDEEMNFYEIIPYLLQGLTAKMKDWKESYISYDGTDKAIVLHTMEIFPYAPAFNDFVMEDWMELPQ